MEPLGPSAALGSQAVTLVPQSGGCGEGHAGHGSHWGRTVSTGHLAVTVVGTATGQAGVGWVCLSGITALNWGVGAHLCGLAAAAWSRLNLWVSSDLEPRKGWWPDAPFQGEEARLDIESGHQLAAGGPGTQLPRLLVDTRHPRLLPWDPLMMPVPGGDAEVWVRVGGKAHSFTAGIPLGDKRQHLFKWQVLPFGPEPLLWGAPLQRHLGGEDVYRARLHPPLALDRVPPSLLVRPCLWALP